MTIFITWLTASLGVCFFLREENPSDKSIAFAMIFFLVFVALSGVLVLEGMLDFLNFLVGK